MIKLQPSPKVFPSGTPISPCPELRSPLGQRGPVGRPQHLLFGTRPASLPQTTGLRRSRGAGREYRQASEGYDLSAKGLTNPEGVTRRGSPPPASQAGGPAKMRSFWRRPVRGIPERQTTTPSELLNDNRGQVLVVAMVLLLMVLAVSMAIVSLLMTTSRASLAITRSRVLTEAAAAGMERSLWCLTQSSPAVCGGSPGASYAGESNLTIGAATVTTTVDSVDANTRTLSATARLTGASLTFRATAKNRLDPVAFVYATQIGDGGLTMNNNSTVNGDLFSNGSIAGATGATLNGDVSVASTTILKATVNGAARADTIKDSTINGDAYYQTLINTPVSGTKFPGTPAPAPLELPITSATIAAWKEDAASGGITLGDYRPDAGSSVSLGPREITGNLILDNNQILTLTGTVYVRGNIEISNNATIRLDSAYGSNSGIFVADGTIHLENNGNFQGAGAGSFLMFFSAAAGSGHHDSAIDLHNNASGTVFYASRGLIHLHNNVEVSELAGFKVHLSNNAVVNYNEALKDAVFASGPGGRWALVKGTFREIK